VRAQRILFATTLTIVVLGLIYSAVIAWMQR